MPEVLAARAASQGMTALALTDRDGLYGAVKHVRACQAEGIAPILGCELAVIDEAGHLLGRVVVLATGSREGYAALCHAVSAAHENGKKPAIKRTRLAELAVNERLIVLIGPLSDVGQSITGRRQREARTLLHRWVGVMPERSIVIEVVCHLAEPGQPGSITPASRMLTLAESQKLPAVLTNAVRYAEPTEAATADVADAARLLKRLDEIDELQPTGQAWLKSGEEMERLARQVVATSSHERSAIDLLQETARLAERCVLDAVRHVGIGTPVMPEASVIGIKGDPLQVLWQKAQAGISSHYPSASDAMLRKVQTQLAESCRV